MPAPAPALQLRARSRRPRRGAWLLVLAAQALLAALLAFTSTERAHATWRLVAVGRSFTLPAAGTHDADPCEIAEADDDLDDDDDTRSHDAPACSFAPAFAPRNARGAIAPGAVGISPDWVPAHHAADAHLARGPPARRSSHG